MANRRSTAGAIRSHALVLRSAIWALFLVWTALEFVIVPWDLGAAQVRDLVSSPVLQQTLIQILDAADAVWVVLAAINVYLYLADAEGLGAARRWAGIILAGSALLCWTGAVTGWPFGPLVYTGRLGFQLGGVLPFTVPLLWLVIVISSRFVAAKLLPRANRALVASVTGLLTVATDANLEFAAWRVRAYWIWYPRDLHPPPSPPWQNFASWFVAAAVFAFLLRGEPVVPRRASVFRPALMLGLMNALFLCVRIVWAIRSGGELSH